MGYSIQTSWPHVLPPLQDPHVASIASQLGRTPSQVLHRWALQRGVGVIPKTSSQQRIIENAKLLEFELSEVAMRLLDGLATLSETGLSVRPRYQEDVYGLVQTPSVPTVSHNGMSAKGTAAAATTSVVPAWGALPEHGSPEMLSKTRDTGFPYRAIQESLLGAAIALSPGECQQRCIAEPRCAAWEVCAPLDKSAGCEGCYLISRPPPTAIRLEG